MIVKIEEIEAETELKGSVGAIFFIGGSSC
jgi:hypothetical protein